VWLTSHHVNNILVIPQQGTVQTGGSTLYWNLVMAGSSKPNPAEYSIMGQPPELEWGRRLGKGDSNLSSPPWASSSMRTDILFLFFPLNIPLVSMEGTAPASALLGPAGGMVSVI
jgi:hypothetical protein